MSSIRSQLLGGSLFLIFLIWAMVSFMGTFSPKPYIKPTAPFNEYDRQAMHTALSPDKVQASLEKIKGSRAPLQPGFNASQKLLVTSFEAAGMKVLRQSVDAIRPMASMNELICEGDSLKVWPFFPNHLQPMNTPETGLQGELFLVNDASLRDLKNPQEKIALLDLALPRPKGFGFIAARYADIGFKALVVTHSKGIDQMSRELTLRLTMDVPLNFVRVMTEPSILKKAGKKITLRVNSRFEKLPVDNLFSILKSSGEAKEALIIPVTLDAISLLPDMAQGSIQALQVATVERLLAGLLPYRESIKRDVIFIATAADFIAQHSLNEMLRAMGRMGQNESQHLWLLGEREKNLTKLNLCKELLTLFADPSFATDIAKTDAVIATLSDKSLDLLKTQLQVVLKSRLVDLGEIHLQARIALDKSNDKSTTSLEYKAMRQSKQNLEQANNLVSYSIEKCLRQSLNFDLRELLKSRIIILMEHHKKRLNYFEQSIEINRAVSNYRSMVVFSPMLNPVADALSPQEKGSEEITCASGFRIHNAAADNAFREILLRALQDLKINKDLSSPYYGKNHGDRIASQMKTVPNQAVLWSKFSYPAATLVNSKRDYDAMRAPEKIDLNVSYIQRSLLTLGEMTLSLAFGNGNFEAGKIKNTYNHHGYVYKANVGNSIIPNFPVKEALVFNKPNTPNFSFRDSAYYSNLIVATDSYGHYEAPYCLSDFTQEFNSSLEAVEYDQSGSIISYKDEGSGAQKIFKSISLSYDKFNRAINLVLFRSQPVVLLDKTNPQTLNDFSGISFIRKEGMQPFSTINTVVGMDGFAQFIQPEETFFVTLKAGSASNELVQETREFLLNNPIGYRGPGENEIEGLGYLAKDTPLVTHVASEAAKSMLYLNDKRLQLQVRHGMADEMTLSFQKKAHNNKLKASESEPLKTLERKQLASSSATYSILNHPIIRNNINEAIWGILWYLGLLVPFVFFFEKLLFASTDIRKALVTQAIIFLVVFLALRLLHPAFEMIRSSVMILLGFVMLLVSSGITIILSGKFKENLEALQQSQGRVKGTGENRMGILITAFMLGLNNMNRRKVRTGLTCTTLILLTFVMICFTSIQSNVVDSETGIGKAFYQGILVKEDSFKEVNAGRLQALRIRFGQNYDVCERVAYLPHYDWEDSVCLTPNIEIEHAGKSGILSFEAKSALLFDANEPLKIPLSGNSHWFESLSAKNSVIISDVMAQKLEIDAAHFSSSKIILHINGSLCPLIGIFDSKKLDVLLDNDGFNLLPFDVDAVPTPEVIEEVKAQFFVVGSAQDPKISSAQVILGRNNHFDVPILAGGKSDKRMKRRVSVVINMADTPYKVARQTVDTYLEESGAKSYYGLNGVSYIGQRARNNTLAGLVDMLIPLLIAGLTVLNTMKGSVYERREEIFVYNAVGIAPRYIFFMFIAEAMVYAVIGSLLGYILSQGTGKVLIALNLTGGMNMNFTSIASVYASLTIVVAVFISTYFPAKSAMDIASPSDDAGWKLPIPEEDTLSFQLPFTFNQHDRIAVLAFFHRFIENHGEGSAGTFFAGMPLLAVDAASENNTQLTPLIRATIWLKPFDLGVSQNMEIQLPLDQETGEYVSTVILTHMSGSKESWERLNVAFISKLRQQFLHWRAVPEKMKVDLFADAQSLIRRDVITTGATIHV